MSEPLSFNHAPADESAPHIGMAPLVDIVLLLICFYLLVMQSMQARTDDRIELPRMANNMTTELTPSELVVNITAEGALSLNGQPVEPGDLQALLQHERQRAAEAGEALNVVVRADGRQRYGMLDMALAACRDAGMGVVTVRAAEGRPR